MQSQISDDRSKISNKKDEGDAKDKDIEVGSSGKVKTGMKETVAPLIIKPNTPSLEDNRLGH